MEELGFGCRCRTQDTADFTLSHAVQHYAPDLVLEPTHVDVSLTLNIDAAQCLATVVTTVQARGVGGDRLILHGVDFLDVDVPTPGVTFRYTGEEIQLSWDTPFRAAETRDVTVTYRLDRPSTGLFFSSPSEAYPEAPRFAATDNESERARHWLACVDLPSVRPSMTYHLTAPAELCSLANGILMSEEVTGETKTSHWELKEPCPSYLACFAVGAFVRIDQGTIHGVPIASFATTDFNTEDLERTFGRTPSIMEWLVRRLEHDFPYPKYYQIALPAIGGAMENISLTTWDDRFVCDENVHRELERLVDLVNVHEMAHSYFGDMVVCRDFAHVWLKESWATYMQQCFFQECLGDDEGQLEYYDQLNRYLEETERYVRPIVTRQFVSSWEMYDMHLYPGGACRLHMLRAELGETGFWKGVKTYLAENASRPVETDDFRRAMEQASGRSLGRFFDQWFHGLGYPQLKAKFTFDKAQSIGRFELEQTQIDEKKNIKPFNFDIQIGWVINGELLTRTVHMSDRRVVVTVPMHTEPVQVRIDPEHRVLHRLDFNPGSALLIEQLMHAPDVIGRIQAGEELARSAKRPALIALDAQYDIEPFWGVRKYWAAAIGKVGTQQAVSILSRWVLAEQDPRVMRELFTATSRHQDPALAQAILSRLEGDLPHVARQSALTALGRQSDTASMAYLKAHIRIPGWGGWAQSGVFDGLAATRSEEATRLLMQQVPLGETPENCRYLAVKALGNVGCYQSKKLKEEVVDLCITLLRDPHHRVRRHAMLALKVLNERRVLPYLENYERSVSAQERVEVRRVIQSISAGSHVPEADLRKDVEALQAKVRKLELTLQTLENCHEA